MKARELRIGNIVKSTGPETEFCFIDEISMHGPIRGIIRNHNGSYSCSWDTSTMPEPIPLTEDWLLKFGFELREARGCNVFKFGILHLLHSDSLSYGCSFDPENNDSWFTEIKYMHQLQNLYFALTGEELAIKEAGV